MNWFKLQFQMKFRLKLLSLATPGHHTYPSRYVKCKVDSWQMFYYILNMCKKWEC